MGNELKFDTQEERISKMRSPFYATVLFQLLASVHGLAVPQWYCLDYTWTQIGGRCYLSPIDQETFEGAQQACQAYGANLVSYATAEEEYNVDTQLAHYPEEWIGLRKNDTNGEGFYWLDGTTLDHVNWQLGEPTANGECVIDATEYYGDGWKVTDCSDQIGYTCEMRATLLPPPPPPTTPPFEGPCLDSTWTLIDNRCYLSPVDIVSFDVAQQACQAYGANLVSYATAEEEYSIDAEIYHYPEEWIGLRKNDTNGEGFYWLDGTALDHVNWQLGEPTANGDCVIDATEYYGDGWKVYDCNDLFGYTCEMAAKES